MPVPNRCCCRRVSAIGTNKLLHDHLAEKGTFRVFYHMRAPPLPLLLPLWHHLNRRDSSRSTKTSARHEPCDNLRLEMRGKRIFKLFHVWLFFFFFFFAFSFAFFWILRLVASEYMTFFIPVSPRRYCHPLLLAPPICSPLIPLQLLNVDCDFVPGCCVTLNVHKISSACGTTKVISVSLVFCVCVFSLSLSLSLSEWHMLQ